MNLIQEPTKTFSNTDLNKPSSIKEDADPYIKLLKREPLSTKKAVELLLNGNLRSQVCRYCLNIAFPLSELDQNMHIAGRGAMYQVAVRDMVASFHPFKVENDPNFPNKICNKCLNQVIRSYLFAQQCEQAERAIRNCFDDMYEKLEKLDPVEKTKRRGRQKLNPNHNILYTEHQKVIDYAEPIRNLINSGSVSFTKEPNMNDLECKKCWQVLPDAESLVNHDKIHPKNMWLHCRLCGKSFAKRYQMNRHLRYNHKPKSLVITDDKNDFECKECGHISSDYLLHLQHIEKHKFRTVLQHLVERNMNKLCSVCLDRSGKMVDMDKIVCLHGGYPELTGDRTMYNILGSTVPEMNILHNHTGTKICEKCFDHAIISYIFIHKTHYIRNRLETCIDGMLDNLKEINPENKLIIEIAQNSILPMQEQFDENLLLDETDDIDENKLKVDVLEDEFRIKSDSEESDTEEKLPGIKQSDRTNIDLKPDKPTDTKLLNGFQTLAPDDVCSEFLTFNKKKKLKQKCIYTCPLCNKHFISDYFLKKHLLKHINKNVKCNLCCTQFKSKFYLQEHKKLVHVLKKISSSCKTCGRMFVSDKKMLTHQKCHTSILCQLCSKTFLSQKHYDSHIQRHASKFNLCSKQKTKQNCSFCEKECKNENDLSIHVNKVHLQIKPYGCDMCEKQFYAESNLRSHKKLHSLFSKEKCEFCMKTLKCRKNLVIHVRKHIGIKPYKCVICPQAFYSEFKVKKHMNKWHGGMFFCKQCKKVFVSKNGLKTHVSTAHSVF